MDIRNLSAKYTAGREKPLNQEKKKETALSDDHATQEKKAMLKPFTIARTPPLTAEDPFPCMEKSESSEIDHDRNINAFIRQALDQAPESERRIWARMKEELGIR